MHTPLSTKCSKVLTNQLQTAHALKDLRKDTCIVGSVHCSAYCAPRPRPPRCALRPPPCPRVLPDTPP